MPRSTAIPTALIAYSLALSIGSGASAAVTIVGGSTLNGDFNLPGGTGDVTYANTPFWENIGDFSNSRVCLKDDRNLDGTHNIVLLEGPARQPGLDTGYSIQEGDTFSIQYEWVDEQRWNDPTDQVKVRLFVTDDDTITGTQTDLVASLSGISSANNTYETVDQDNIYTATVSDTGKRLFVALDTEDGNSDPDGLARIDNFELTVSTAPVVLPDIIGGDILNGNFNAPGTSGNVSFANTPNWVNIGDWAQGRVCLKDDKDLDGTHNINVFEGPTRTPGIDTGHDLQANTVFSIQYYWRDDSSWDDGSDQVKIRLFVTNDDNLTQSSIQTNLVEVLSGLTAVNNGYKLVDQDEIYFVDPALVGKRLFIALDTEDGNGNPNGNARVDNFVLSVAPFDPIEMTGSKTESESLELDWPTTPRAHYTLMESPDLAGWSDLESWIRADSSTLERTLPLDTDAKFYRVRKEAPTPLVDPATPPDAQPFLDTPTGDKWVLDFSDEFNGTNLDTRKWTVDISTKSRNPRTDRGINDWWWVSENVSLDGAGNLVLDVVKHDHNTMHCGSISSDGLYEPQYGYFEARIQIADTTKDTHTAFWLQGPNMNNSDPADGTAHDGAEIDIFESAWFGNYTKSVVHIDGYDADHRANTKRYDTPGLHSGYHVFGLEWTADHMKIYHNGQHRVTYTGIWVPKIVEWVWLSVGASFGDIGTFASEPNGFLTSAKVDYVRVWKSKP